MIQLFKRLFCQSADREQYEHNLLFSIFDNSLCSDHLLSFLSVNDLLRLRRVCKSSKNIVEYFIQTKKVKSDRKFEFTISEEENFAEYSKKCQRGSNSLPIPTHVHFAKFTEKDEHLFYVAPVRNFVVNCGSAIRHLSVGKLQVRMSSRKPLFKFLESFPNVTHLVLEHIGPYEVNSEGYISVENEPQFPMIMTVPPSLKNLKTLIIRESWNSENTFAFVMKLVEACLPNLERLSLPFEQFLEGERKEHVVDWACNIILNAHNFKLEDVDGKFLDKLLQSDEIRTPEMGSLSRMIKSINSKVVSIKNPQSTSSLGMICDLEQIDFQSFFDSTITNLNDLESNWPGLNKISVCFRSRHWNQEVWEFLFGVNKTNDGTFDWRKRLEQEKLVGGGRKRENVTMLDIKFEAGLSFGNRSKIDDEQIYKTFDVMASCPNLKVLHFEAYCYERVVSLVKLWEGLPLLEELRFNHCKTVRDPDFMGYQDPWYPEKPAPFLNLKKLRKLEFLNICMASVSDELLREVICHMPLKELSVSSKCFDHHITLEGIQSLLNGIFATTIEQLSLEKLQLRRVTDEMKRDVEKQFRSSKMI